MVQVRTPFAAAVALSFVVSGAHAADDPWADEVIEYIQGENPAMGYIEPLTALGPPDRCTGNLFEFGAVTPFYPAWSDEQLVSLGAGGSLTVRFDEPVVDDPNNPYGQDLLVFGNTGLVDIDGESGIPNGGVFGADGGDIYVSADGIEWFLVPDRVADGVWPTLGYLDAGPYDEDPGEYDSRFTKPVNPTWGVADIIGMTYSELVGSVYRRSGGGVGIDIGSVGLASISYVRICNPVDATAHVEVDAIVDVSEIGDIDDSGEVDVPDLLVMLAEWGAVGPWGSDADLDENYVVDVIDVLILLANWG